MNLDPITIDRIKAVEEEYEEPFPEVVKGLAKMGYSKSATAQACEIPRTTFMKVCEQCGLLNCFVDRKDYNESCRSTGKWPKGKLRRPDITNEFLLSLVRDAPGVCSFKRKYPEHYYMLQVRFGGIAKARELAGVE